MRLESSLNCDSIACNNENWRVFLAARGVHWQAAAKEWQEQICVLENHQSGGYIGEDLPEAGRPVQSYK